MPVRELPNNLDAEQAVIGSMFMSKYALEKACETLTKDSFYFDKNAKIFSALYALSDKRIAIDTTTLTSELKNQNVLNEIGGVEYLAEVLNSVPTAGNIDHYIRIVEDSALLRGLIETTSNIANEAYSKKDGSIEDIISAAETKILSIVKNKRSTEFRNIKEVLSSTYSMLEVMSNSKGGITGLPTGWTQIDKITKGLQPTQLVIIAARTGVGKTAWALNLATSVAINTDKTVAIFNLEMPGEQLANRMISSLGQIEMDKLISGNIRNDMNRINEAISQLENTKIYIDDTLEVTINEIRSKCRRLASSEDGLGLVIIDYLQLINTTTDYRGNRQLEVADIARSLKKMAMELKIPVVALAQLSRSADQRTKGGGTNRPRLSDLRESGAIEQDADIVGFISREDYHDAEKRNDESISDVEFIIAKNRNGAPADVKLRFRGDTQTYFTVVEDKKGDKNV
jgi:replicative DNA helicase